ncbi:MAG: hypothetical protein HUJ65_02245, partial [Oscillospiraceae bacterium]|nr:hypothetical protein [Oscillospiraceae bacterium]
MKSKTRTHVFLSLITILAILISVTSATYAWFTSHTAVNVEPMDGTVGHSEGSLLISATPDGEFSTTCELIASTPENGLSPLSTADLNAFFRARTQDQNEVIIDFTDAGDRADADSIHGHLYLKSTITDSDVYLLRQQLDFGTQVQTIAALRLGLKITIAGESYT